MDPAPDDAHRRRPTGQGEQVHHAPRAARQACGNPQAASRQRSADDHAARRQHGQGRSACGVSRERFLGNAREPQECGRERHPRAASREDARMTISFVSWSQLTPDERRAALRRPAQEDGEELQQKVRAIVADVRTRGDAALHEYTERFDGVRLDALEVSRSEYAAAQAALSAEQIAALERAIADARAFQEAPRAPTLVLETSPGVVCERHYRPIDAVGLYVPAGVAPLPSAAIMTAVPAAIAGCRTRILCTPPRKDGTADPAVLVAAQLCQVERVFKVGGAQAIAAMAYGTQTIPKVDKVFGPGNAWVTAAKLLCANDPEGAALDLPAGPSEVLVIADDSARAD